MGAGSTSPFSLASKFAVASVVLILLSLGLCGLGTLINDEYGRLFTAGALCLLLGVVGLLIAAVMAIVFASRKFLE
jgi:hypothetical protein